MSKIRRFAPVFLFLVFTSCGKFNQDIDVSHQMLTDESGNFWGGDNTDQWKQRDFSSTEKHLFDNLDTADLSHTIKPDTVASISQFPNPFRTVTSVIFAFTPDYDGELVFKYVIVDRHMNIKDQGALRIKGHPNPNNLPVNSSSDFIHLTPDTGDDRYRMYVTLSAESSPDFYRTWGNIQKSQ